MLTTPNTIHDKILELRHNLGADGDPVFIPVQPRTDSDINDCPEDVRKQIEHHGGSAVSGWLVWEWTGVFLQAIFHMVWRSEDGDLVDVSEKEDGERRILFIPDSSLNWNGHRIHGQHLPLSENPLIAEYIKVCEDCSLEFDREFGSDFFGDPVPTPRLMELEYRKVSLELQLEIS